MLYCSLAPGEDIIIVQLKIDEVQKQFSELKNKVDDSLEQMEEALPLAQNFQEAHEKFMDWAAKVEPELRSKELLGVDAEEKVQVIYFCFVVLFSHHPHQVVNHLRTTILISIC